MRSGKRQVLWRFSRSRYFTNQTRAQAEMCTLWVFIYISINKKLLETFCWLITEAETVWTARWPRHRFVLEMEVKRIPDSAALTLQGGSLSYLKVRFVGFKEFGSGDGPLPQSPGLFPFSILSVCKTQTSQHSHCKTWVSHYLQGFKKISPQITAALNCLKPQTLQISTHKMHFLCLHGWPNHTLKQK